MGRGSEYPGAKFDGWLGLRQSAGLPGFALRTVSR
jgi:hypothetical protein